METVSLILDLRRRTCGLTFFALFVYSLKKSTEMIRAAVVETSMNLSLVGCILLAFICLVLRERIHSNQVLPNMLVCVASRLLL